MMKVLLLLLGCAALCRGADTPLSGPDIYARMLATYADARSYEDEGEVRTVFFESHGERTVIKPFTTAFVRPDAFRFEFKDRFSTFEAWRRYVIWRSGDTVKSWWTIKPVVQTGQTFEDAIAAATGVSSSSAANITALLMPDMRWGRRLGTLADTKLVGPTQLNGAPVFELQGKVRDGALLTLWIDSRSFLLLQLFEKRQFPSFSTETTTVYSPRVNEPVTPEKLQFNAGQ